MSTINELKKAYDEAKRAADTALDACWSDPKNKTLVKEFESLNFACGEARRAYERAAKESTINPYSHPDPRILAHDCGLSAIQEED